MNRITYSSLRLKTDTSVNTFQFNNQKIEVKRYLPIEDKYDLIMVTLQQAKEGDIYNELKLDMYFHLNIVYLYTNIAFTDKQREDETKLYDALKSNGLIDQVIAAIEEDEYNSLVTTINKMVEDNLKYEVTAAAVIKNLIHDLPGSAQAAADIVDNFDPQRYQAVLDFADAANGGRPRKDKTD